MSIKVISTAAFLFLGACSVSISDDAPLDAGTSITCPPAPKKELVRVFVLGDRTGRPDDDAFRSALREAAKLKPDLILLDTSMPVMNGHEMLERLRKHPDGKDIPVIMCTAMCEPQDVARASAYGIADYVTKPFDCTELIEKITRALEG